MHTVGSHRARYVLGGGTLALVGLVLFFGLLAPLFSVLGGAFVTAEVTHVVSAGQTLEILAGQYRTDTAALKRLNPGVSEAPEAGSRLLVKKGGLSLALFAKTLQHPVLPRQFGNSLLLGVLVTLLCLLATMPAAVVTSRYNFAGKPLVQMLILLPLILPPFVGAVGIKRMLGRFGFFNMLLLKLGLISSPLDVLGGGRFLAVALLETLHLYPVMFLNLQAALAAREQSLEDAAESLGDTPLGSFMRITLPQLVPGIFAGSAITFIWAFTDLGTPLVLEYQAVIARQIFDRVQEIDTDPLGYALVVETLAAALLVFALGRVLAARFRVQGVGKGQAATPPRPLGVRGTAAFWCGFGALSALAMLPHAALVLTAFAERWSMSALPTGLTMQHFNGAMGHPITAGSIRNSVLLSLVSTLLDVVVAVLVGLLASRWFPRLGKAADALAMVPLAVPGIIIAYGFVAAYGGLAHGEGWLATVFAAIDPRVNPMPLLVLSYTIRRLPYTTRAVAAGLAQVPPEVEEASATLGADEATTIRRVTLPLIKGHILAGAMLTFSFAMLEVSDSLILAQKEQHYPITKAIYHMLSRLVDGLNIASALGVFAMLLLLFSLLAASRLSGRRLGDILRL